MKRRAFLSLLAVPIRGGNVLSLLVARHGHCVPVSFVTLYATLVLLYLEDRAYRVVATRALRQTRFSGEGGGGGVVAVAEFPFKAKYRVAIFFVMFLCFRFV